LFPRSHLAEHGEIAFNEQLDTAQTVAGFPESTGIQEIPLYGKKGAMKCMKNQPPSFERLSKLPTYCAVISDKQKIDPERIHICYTG
jgi:hypothetical protein